MEKAPSPLQFRFGHPEDIHALAEVHADAVLSTGGKQDREELIASAEKSLSTALHRPANQFLVAVQDEKPVGYVWYTQHAPKTAEIVEFYIAQPKKHIGSALLKKLAVLLPPETSIDIHATRTAREAYTKLGFFQLGGEEMILPKDRLQLWRESMPGIYPRFQKDAPKPDSGM